MRFTVEHLHEMELPWSAIEDKITGKGRWSLHHEIIFAHDDKFYRATYSEGATENQDEGPWEGDKYVECEEVRPVEKLVKTWERV